MKLKPVLRSTFVAVVLGMLAVPAQSLAGQIVFQHGSQSSGSSLWVMPDTGGTAKELTASGVSNPAEPNLFPNSTNLAFSASAPGLAGYSGAEACGYNCIGIYSVLGGTLRRVSPQVVSCAADTTDCATQIDQDPSLTADGRVVYEHEGGLVGQICDYYDCGVYGGLSSAFLVQSDVGGDTPASWATSNGDGTGGQYQATYPLDAPSADPGNADLVAYPSLEDYNCSSPDACDPLSVDEQNGTGAYNITDASCSCGSESDLSVLGWSPNGQYILVDYGAGAVAPGVWIFKNQSYGYAGAPRSASGAIYGEGWWVAEPASGATIGQGGAITSNTQGQGQVIFAYDGDIVSIPGSCWGGTPTVAGGQTLTSTIAPTCTSFSELTSGGQDNYPTWTSSTGAIGVASNVQPPPPAKKATSTLGKVAVSGTSLSVSLKCSAGSGDCADEVGLATDETLHGSKVTALSAVKAKHKVVLVASVRVTLAAGKSKTIKLTLNRSGKKLLAKFHKLPALLLVVQGSKTVGSSRQMFKLTKPKHRHH
jgi:hypothetical protein